MEPRDGSVTTMAPGKASRLGSLVAFLVFGTIAYFYGTPQELGVLGYFLLGLLGVKLVLALCYTPVRARRGRAGPPLDAAVVVPIYNEDPEILRRCLLTILDQTEPPRTVMVIDDGSSSDDAARIAETLVGTFLHRGVRLLVLRQERNMGKREALARGFLTAPHADVYIGVDSDTVLHAHAFAELLAPMSADKSVTGVTGMVLASNYKVNVLTRLIELRYANAFLYERAAYSVLRSVLCCCGSLAAYRGWVAHKYLDDFRTQTFMGQPAVVGDDRRLTNYCLLEGKVLLQSSALAETAVPERMGHYLRQQSRWNRSFFRETLWCLKTFPFRRPVAFVLSFIEIASWLVFTATLLYSLVIFPLVHGRFLLPQYSAMIVCFGYLRSVRYLDLPRPGIGPFGKLGIFMLAPLYGLMHIVLLLPIRVFSLMTLQTANWGTRQQVEVAVEPAAHAEPAPLPPLPLPPEPRYAPPVTAEGQFAPPPGPAGAPPNARPTGAPPNARPAGAPPNARPRPTAAAPTAPQPVVTEPRHQAAFEEFWTR
ncbi:glycosyltransferase [Actinomadura fulvescens]